MSSQRKHQQQYAKLRVMRIIKSKPEITSRQIAEKIGISNGSAYYILIALIDKGHVKILNFKESSQKARYSYLLTPKGIREKSLLTQKFLIRKKEEYKALSHEIAQLEQDIGISKNYKNIKMK